MRIEHLGLMAYRDAWAVQERAHQQVVDGEIERILLVEHPPVITFGRRPDVRRNLIASDEQLSALDVEVVQSDRGGDITFHGPGQIIAYPIIRLIDHKLSVGSYVRALESAAIRTLATFGINAGKDACAIGVWVRPRAAAPAAKIAAVGVRVKRGVTLHGLALNVATDLRYFNLIVPCGLTGRPVTSITQLLGRDAPEIGKVREQLAEALVATLSASPVVIEPLPIVGEGRMQCENVGADAASISSAVGNSADG